MTNQTLQPAMNQRRRSSPGSGDHTGRSRRPRREFVDAPSPYPAVDGVPGKPRWWERLRGVVGLTVLVTVLGVITAVAVSVLLVLVVVAIVSTIA